MLPGGCTMISMQSERAVVSGKTDGWAEQSALACLVGIPE